MADNTRRGNELVLAVSEQAFILDSTKGHISVYVGPSKTSLSETDYPVLWDDKSRRFVRTDLDRSINPSPYVPEGSYMVLSNPSKTGEHPKAGLANSMVELQMGKKINIPGPISFPLWAQQTSQVIPGHQLRSNQYLVVRVYNDEAARENWNKAVVKLQTNSETTNSLFDVEDKDIVMGKMFVIRGTDVSFYIPPTGVEVVPDENGKYVQDAVTLEQLEYCILLDESGTKRFEKGPAVIFPEPTEKFLLGKNNERKFRAIELNDISGIHIKVIQEYTEDDGTKRKVGEELFVTGKNQSIYFPRHEHAIIKYGEREKSYAVAVPAGEGRYVLNRLTGKINLVKGPSMYLPDPRTEVIVRRILDRKKVELWFPGNIKAIEVNQKLFEESKQQQDFSADYLEQPVSMMAAFGTGAITSGIQDPYTSTTFRRSATERFAGDEIKRGQTYTPPRTITIDSKYEGAVLIDVWTGYAVLVTSKTGQRRVVVGPQTVLLEYDETLMPIQLSTGKPKSTNSLYETVYLRVLNNLVSDIVDVETKDFCNVQVKLSYRINFEGDPEKWFNVENYVKYICDHGRSKLRNAIRKIGIEEFYSNGINIIRDIILGLSEQSKPRPGLAFSENGVRVYDVEVLGMQIQDKQIAEMLSKSQHSVVQKALAIVSEQQELSYTERSEEIKQKVAKVRWNTAQTELELSVERIKKQLEVNLQSINAEVEQNKVKLESEKALQVVINEKTQSELNRSKLEETQRLEFERQEVELRAKMLLEEAKAIVEKAKGISPDLIAALQSFQDAELLQKVASSMSPLAILGGTSISEVLSKLLKGTALETVSTKLLNGNNGNIEESVRR